MIPHLPLSHPAESMNLHQFSSGSIAAVARAPRMPQRTRTTDARLEAIYVPVPVPVPPAPSAIILSRIAFFSARSDAHGESETFT